MKYPTNHGLLVDTINYTKLIELQSTEVSKENVQTGEIKRENKNSMQKKKVFGRKVGKK